MTTVRLLGAFLLVLVGAPSAQAHTLAPFTPEDLVRLQRLSDPQPSPNGRYLVMVLRLTDIAANDGRTHLVLIDRTGLKVQARALAWNVASDWSPRWASNSRTIYFLSTRSGLSQVWRMSLDDLQPYEVTDY